MKLCFVLWLCSKNTPGDAQGTHSLLEMELGWVVCKANAFTSRLCFPILDPAWLAASKLVVCRLNVSGPRKYQDKHHSCQPKAILQQGGAWPRKFALCHFDLSLKMDLGNIPSQKAVAFQRCLNCPKEVILAVAYLCLAAPLNCRSRLLWQAGAWHGSISSLILSNHSWWCYFSEASSEPIQKGQLLSWVQYITAQDRHTCRCQRQSLNQFDPIAGVSQTVVVRETEAIVTGWQGLID